MAWEAIVDQEICPRCGDSLRRGAACRTCRPLRPEYLARLLEYRASPPTVGRLLRLCAPVHLFMIVLLGGLAAVNLALSAELLAAGIVGGLIGALARDVGWCRRSAQLWPEQATVMDWARIEKLASETAK